MLAEDGLRISFDVSTVLSEGSGSVEIHYKLPLGQSVLGQLPVRGCQVRLAHAAEACSTRGAVLTRVADQAPRQAS